MFLPYLLHFVLSDRGCGLRVTVWVYGIFCIVFFFLGHDMGELVGHQVARFCGIIGMAFVWGCFGSTFSHCFRDLVLIMGAFRSKSPWWSDSIVIAAADLVCIMQTSAVSAKLSISIGKGSM